MTTAGGPVEVGPRTQPVRSRKTFSSAGCGQALRRARPFERRALRTLRPPLVVMRARKPWVRLRLTVLGWYVRFMFLVPFGSAGCGKGRKLTCLPIVCQRIRFSRGNLWITGLGRARLAPPSCPIQRALQTTWNSQISGKGVYRNLSLNCLHNSSTPGCAHCRHLMTGRLCGCLPRTGL